MRGTTIIAALCLCATGVAAGAPLDVLGTHPDSLLVGPYPAGRLPLEIYLIDSLPDDLTATDIDRRLQVDARADNGKFERLDLDDWTPKKVTVWIPNRLVQHPGPLQLRARLDGDVAPLIGVTVDGAPTEPPGILGITPNPLPPTDHDAPLFYISGTHVDARPFTSVSVAGIAAPVDDVDRDSGVVTVRLPNALIGRAGTYAVRLTNRAGTSQSTDLRVAGTPPQ